jgi:hypothetical protein
MTSFNFQSIKNNKKAIIAILVILVLLAIAYWYFVIRKKQIAEVETEEAASLEPAKPMDEVLAAADFTNCTDSFPLKLGKCGKRVEQLQMWLLKQYGAQFTTYGIDGKWGEETDHLVRKHLLKDSVSEDYFYKVGAAQFITVRYK